MNRVYNPFKLIIGILFTLGSCNKAAYSMKKNPKNYLSRKRQDCLRSRKNEQATNVFSYENPYKIYSNKSCENEITLKDRIDFVKKYKIEHISYRGPGDRVNLETLVANLERYPLKSFKMAITSNFFNGTEGAAFLSRLDQLTELEACRVGIGNEDVKYLANLENLISLKIGGNNISYTGVTAFANLKKLKYLDLHENPIGEDEGVKDLVKDLAQLGNLIYLNLRRTAIQDEDLKYVATLENITELDLSCNDLGDEGVKYLPNMKQLTNLTIAANENISDAGAKYLSNMKQLEYLDVCYTQIGNAGAKDLAKLEKLRYLSIAQTSIGDEGRQALLELQKRNGMELELELELDK